MSEWEVLVYKWSTKNNKVIICKIRRKDIYIIDNQLFEPNSDTLENQYLVIFYLSKFFNKRSNQ